jgi:hypothetical protein
MAQRVLRHFRARYLAAAFAAWRRWHQRKAYLAAVFGQLQGKGHTQLMHIVWTAWRSFVPHSQGKRQVADRTGAHWRRRALILCCAGWHEVAALQAWQRQQLAAALMRWDGRRMWLALEGWRAVLAYKQTKRQKLERVRLLRRGGWGDASCAHLRSTTYVCPLLLLLLLRRQGLSRRQQGVLAASFQDWRASAQLQVYRRNVIAVVSHKVSNGLLLRAYNCWR